MGYRQHPYLAKAIGQGSFFSEDGLEAGLGATSQYAKECKQIVYHVDLHSQYFDLSDVEKRWAKTVGKNAVRTKLTTLKDNEALRHFRAIACRSCYYEMPSSVASDTVPLAQVIGLPSTVDADTVAVAEIGAACDVEELAHAGGSIFMKLVHSNPCSLHLDRADTKLAFGWTQLAFTTHRVVQHDSANGTAVVAVQPQTTAAKVSNIVLVPANNFQLMTVWQSTLICASIKECHPALRA